jgi:formate hydrogenlyase subunit 4
MGAAREARFAALLEPALFLVVGALCLISRSRTLHEALALQLKGGGIAVWLFAVVALFIVLQVETARMPVDDPTTHLELTMVHEVMVLDHSGTDLAAIQWGAAIKFFSGAAIVATMLNPWAGQTSVLAGSTNLVLCALIAIVIGTIESLIARIKLRAVPKYIVIALLAGAAAAIATTWRTGGNL